MSFAVRNSHFPHMCRASLRFPHLSFIPPLPYPPLRGTFPSRGRLYAGDSGTLANDALETIFSLSFIPLVPYPARSARHLPHAGKALYWGQRHSRKWRTCDDLSRSFSSRFPHPTSAPSGHLLPMEGGSVHASPFPWKGLPSAARQGWLPFWAAKPPPLCLPHLGKGTAQRRSRIRCS